MEPPDPAPLASWPRRPATVAAALGVPLLCALTMMAGRSTMAFAPRIKSAPRFSSSPVPVGGPAAPHLPVPLTTGMEVPPRGHPRLTASQRLPLHAVNALDGEDPFLLNVLRLAQDAAIEAGAVIRKAWGTGVARSDVAKTKSGAADLVTATDMECEKIISRRIREQFPDHIIVGEESASGTRYNLTSAPTWTIDPVDGTTNFVHKWPWTCVLVAFLRDREPVVSVTYDPVRDEMYWAVKGLGAFLRTADHEVPLRVSGTQNVDQAVVVLEVGYCRTAKANRRVTGTMDALLRRNVRSIRMSGSSGLNLASIAAGKVDAFIEEGSWEEKTGPSVWDFAAGRLLVEEAGGVFVAPDGGPFEMGDRSTVAAASPALARQLVAAIREASEPVP